MRTPEEVQAEMDATEEAHERRMNALHDELHAAEAARDPGCHAREHERIVAIMTESLKRSDEYYKSLDAEQDDTEQGRRLVDGN